MIVAILTGAFLTSIISGVLALGGGVLLMGLYAYLLPVPTAMILHGVTQAGANGSRVFLFRKHIVWKILPPFIIGAAFSLTVLSLIVFVPNKAFIFTAIGAFTLIGIILKNVPFLDIERPLSAMLCGTLVIAFQLLAGPSGPALDLFYARTKMTKNQIIATKSLTQTLAHITKFFYYGYIIWTQDISIDLPFYIYPAVIILTIFGTHIGKTIVDRLSDEHFKKAYRYVVFSTGAAYLFQGISLIFTPEITPEPLQMAEVSEEIKTDSS
jgi:uncharacterized membrane protein YfcA